MCPVTVITCPAFICAFFPSVTSTPAMESIDTCAVGKLSRMAGSPNSEYCSEFFAKPESEFIFLALLWASPMVMGRPSSS